jgi:uncharacterized protein YndB with AHSA1/START domain
MGCAVWLGVAVIARSGEEAQNVKAVSNSTNGSLMHAGVVEAPVAAVWEVFTTKAGIESWMVAHAEVDLKIGGKMRTNYNKDGAVDDAESIENTILSFDPPRMLSIQATKAPASFPFKVALQSMWTVIYFEELAPGRTTVTVVGHGFDPSEESQKMREHFDRGNAYTIAKLQERFARKSN